MKTRTCRFSLQIKHLAEVSSSYILRVTSDMLTPSTSPSLAVTTVTSSSAWFLDVLDFLNAERRIMVTLSAIFIIIGSLPAIPAIASGVGGTFFTLRVAQSAGAIAVSLGNWLKPAQGDAVERQQTVEGDTTMVN